MLMSKMAAILRIRILVLFQIFLHLGSTYAVLQHSIDNAYIVPGYSHISPVNVNHHDHLYASVANQNPHVIPDGFGPPAQSQQNETNHLEVNNMIFEELTTEEANQDYNFNELIKLYEQMDLEQVNQDRYLTHFQLHRVPIIGDGNCLFRSISFSLYGHEDNHLYLRNLATDTLRANLNEFSDYFLSDRGTPIEQINRLSQINTYAGQECILALAKALNLNILVTFGGDETSSEVVTMENTFEPNSVSQNQIHIIWRRFGGGHYEAITDLDSNEVPTPLVHPSVPTLDSLHTKPWKKTTKYSKKINLSHPIKPGNLDIHSYVKSDNSFSEEHIESNKHSYSRKELSNEGTANSLYQKYICPICKLSFSKSVSLRNHKLTHKQKYENSKNRKGHTCMVSTCCLRFRTSDQLVQHEIEAHGANVLIEDLDFENKEDFTKFKEHEEMALSTRFVLRNKVQENKKKERVYSLDCHRNGCTRSHKKKGYQKRTIRSNSKGNCQMNSRCPAKFSVREKVDGSIHVKYIKSHTHSLTFENSKFLPIPENIKSEILGMLSLKIPINNIMDKIRERFSDRDHRDNLEDVKYYNLIDRKTIHNLKTKLADPSIMQHSSDATSIYLKVEMLKKEKFNPVLIFKGQDIENDHTATPGLQKEDFMLVLMTKQQLEIYQRFADRIICMDSTHATNSYSFKLITLLVPDQFRKGYPVAFCISNREDETAISLFLKSVKSRSPNTSVNILMTDDDNAGWNAARSVFGDSLKHYLCVWHVYRTWTRKIQQHFKEDDHKGLVFSLLCAMLEARTEDLFQKYKSVFTSKLQTLNPRFLQYMQDNYFCRSDKWAKCYRKGDYCHVDTNMFVESFHNQLKSIYFEGKRNSRLDVLLETLLKLENNLFVNHYRRVSYNLPSTADTLTQNRHASSLQIPDKNIIQVSNKRFTVESSGHRYIIEINKNFCDQEHCYVKCKDLPCIDLCYHLYVCSCPDFENGNLCKHIHKVHSIQGNTRSTFVDDCEVQCEDIFVNPIQDPSQVQNSLPDLTNQYDKIKGLMEKIDEQIKDPKVMQLRYTTILQTLQTIVSGNEACLTLPRETGGLKQTEKVPGNANNILQPRFHRTEKRKGRPRKAPLRKPTEQEKEQLLVSDDLHGEADDQGPQQDGPSVAPYPPLRLVPRSSPLNTIPSTPDQPLFQVNGELGVPSWMRIPPSMIGSRITVSTSNGKKQVLIFSRGEEADKDHFPRHPDK